jgi:hypothetical protein
MRLPHLPSTLELMAGRLIEKLDFKLHEVLGYDLGIGVLGGVGALWLAFESPRSLTTAAAPAIGVVGVVIGAVVGGMAVIAAFMDGVFLRKIHRIGHRADRYITPFAFTAMIGVTAAMALIVLIALPGHAPKWLFVTVAGLSGLFTFWTVASVWQLLSMTLDFVGLKSDAADVPDTVVNDEATVHQLPSRSTGEGK